MANETPVSGDGVVTIELPGVSEKKVNVMDLPDGVGQLMMTETAGNIQASNRNSGIEASHGQRPISQGVGIIRH